MKDKKQSVSQFTEEQLTPLEQKFADAKANRDAGVEPFKIIPIELWEEVIKSMEYILIDQLNGLCDSLAYMNDFEGKTFPEIADWIEENL